MLFTTYLNHVKSKVAVSKFIKGERHQFNRILKIGSTTGTLEISIGLTATVKHIIEEVERRLFPNQDNVGIELYRARPSLDEVASGGMSLRDSDRVTMDELWAVLPGDYPVIVTVVDIPDFSTQVTVQLSCQVVTFEDVKDALLEQHGTNS